MNYSMQPYEVSLKNKQIYFLRCKQRGI